MLKRPYLEELVNVHIGAFTTASSFALCIFISVPFSYELLRVFRSL